MKQSSSEEKLLSNFFSEQEVSRETEFWRTEIKVLSWRIKRWQSAWPRVNPDLALNHLRFFKFKL